MTDFKAGDKVRVKADYQDDDATQWTLAYVGAELVIVATTRRDGSTIELSRTVDNFASQWELVPEVFEAGKRYQKTSIHSSEPDIAVLWADDAVAFGRYVGTGKHTRHALLYPTERHLYREV